MGYVTPAQLVQAVETILERAAGRPPVSRAPPQSPPLRELLMPELNDNTHAVRKYLIGRGIHPSVIDCCIDYKLLFETKQYQDAICQG